MIKLKEKFLAGSYPPVVTPFRDGKVDYDAYARLVEFQVKEGTHGIVVNGTSAEPSTLSTEERNQLVKVAVQTAAKRIPVVAATGSQSHAETIVLTEFADKAGADALLIVTPYYIRAPQRGRSFRRSGEPSPASPSAAKRLHLAPIAQSGSEQVRCPFPGQPNQPYRFQSVQFCLETRGGGGLAIADSMAALRAASFFLSLSIIRAAIDRGMSIP